METSKIDSILEKLKVRNFPSKKWKDGVRIDIPIVDVRKGTEIDRDVIMERMNRLPSRGVVITEAISEEVPPEIPKTKKISTIQISKPGLEKEPGEIGLEKEPGEIGQEKEPGEIGLEKEPGEIGEEKEPGEIGEEKEPGEPVPPTKTTIRIKKPAVTKKMTPVPVTAPPEIIKMRTSPYYLNNRKLFLQKINQLFEPYMKELASMREEITCGKLKAMGAKGEQFELLMHQRVVRDYINLLSPYRGLLLYHGLGSGKSCSSIAIAEGMKSNRKVYVMTPASLKMNFFTELKRCGDPLYKKNQHWQFVSTVGQPDLQQSLAKTFSLSPDFITKKKGVWTTSNDAESTPNSSGDLRSPSESVIGRLSALRPNFSELTEDEQHGVDDQLNQMIRAKYTDIHYNAPNLRNILVELSQNYTKNPFDDTVVIIDEAHNLVNRIVNKVSKMPKRSTRVNEKTPTSILLYEFLMNASNARIVLLSGTPIINTPSEIGVLFNILRGYIKTWTFPIHVNTTQKVTTETIRAMMERENFKTMDFMEYSQNRLTVTRNPYGFINNKTGTCEPSKKTTTTTRKLPREVTVGGKTRKKRVKLVEKHGTEAPENPEGFVDETKNIDDPVPDGALYVVPTDCTNTKSDKYEPPFLGGAIGDDSADPQYRGMCLDETGNMNDRVFVTKIRDILTKNGLEVTVVPRVELHKCLPDQTDAFVQLFVDTDTGAIKNSDMFVRRILGLTSYFKSAQEGLLPSFVKTDEGEVYHIVRTDMSDYQFEEYASIRKEEYEKEKTQQKMKKKRGTPAPGGDGAELFKDFTSTYRIYSRACCNFAWPKPPGRPIQPLSKKEQVVDEQAVDESTMVVEGGAGDNIDDMGEEQNADDSEEAMEDMDYVTAMQVLNDPKYLSIGNLSMYSSKFTAILERILDDKNQGLHLLYSSFRTLEGIGILKLILLNNGFTEFKLKKTADGDWDIDDGVTGADAGKPTFILYTGTESAEEKEILRNVYNGAWDVIPPIIAKKLEERDRDGKKNIMGKVIKLMMITASGAEGINLKNTRFVHIVEPYWNMVRVDQVVGRARRICSHEELPEEMRTVEVFVYLSVFSDKQKTDRNYIDLMNRDVSRFDESIPVTTDETLYEISLQKSRISQKILTVVKQSSVDCALYNQPGTKSDENLVCYGADMGILKDTDNEFLSYPTIDQDSQVQTKTVVKRTTVTYRDITMKGEKYHLNEATQEIYDHVTFMQGKKSGQRAESLLGETMIPMGRLVKEGTKYKIVPI
jgi:hypothetical protein